MLARNPSKPAKNYAEHFKIVFSTEAESFPQSSFVISSPVIPKESAMIRRLLQILTNAETVKNDTSERFEKYLHLSLILFKHENRQKTIIKNQSFLFFFGVNVSEGLFFNHSNLTKARTKADKETKRLSEFARRLILASSYPSHVLRFHE